MSAVTRAGISPGEPMAQVSRGEELVEFFVRHCDAALGRTRLMKLLYLADYEARRYLGRPISGITYRWHHYGPYDDDLNGYVEAAQKRGAVVEESVMYPSGQRGYIYSAGTASAQPTFSPAEVEILSYVSRQYSRVDLRELLEEIVYQTEPMLDAQKRNDRGPLNMDIVNNAMTKELGTSFEDLLERSRRFRAGEYLEHAAAMALLAEKLAGAAA